MTLVIPLTEPVEVFKGDTIKWRISLADFLPTDSWTLTYEFVQTNEHQNVTGSDNGDGTHLVAITPATSNKFKPGYIRYVGYVDNGTDRYTMRNGGITVRAEYDQRVSGYDGRSHARKMLAAIEAVLEESATDDQLSMSINGRSVTVMNKLELVQLRNEYVEYVRQEDDANKVARGLATGRQVLTRFGNWS